MGFSNQSLWSSTLLLFHTSLPLFFSSLPTSLLHTLPTIPHKAVRVEEIKAGVEEKKKTQGMRRDLAHFYGVFIISVALCHFFSIIFFSATHPLFSSTNPNLYKNIEERKGREEMKNRRAHKVWKKTQGMRRDLGHKVCGWVRWPGFISPLSKIWST